MTEVEPERRLAFEWDDEGEVEFTLDDDVDGTRLTVVETAPGVDDRARPAGLGARTCLTR